MVLQRQDLLLVLPKVIKSQSGYFYDKLQNIRGIIYKELIRVLGTDQGNFVAAILIGETKAINKHTADNMRNSGIAHILSVSGLHLSLVAMIFFISSRFLLNCSNYLSYKINIKVAAGIISIIGSFGYLLLSGANIAATRAFIMTFFVILAIIIERSRISSSFSNGSGNVYLVIFSGICPAPKFSVIVFSSTMFNLWI